MLRFVLAFLYLLGSLEQANQLGGSLDPLGPPPSDTDGGSGWDPLG